MFTIVPQALLSRKLSRAEYLAEQRDPESAPLNSFPVNVIDVILRPGVKMIFLNFNPFFLLTKQTLPL